MDKSTSTSLVSARIPTTLVERIKEELDRSEENLTAFLIKALKNECDRRSMSKPKPKVDLVELFSKLQQVHDVTARLEAQNRLLLSTQGLIKIAVGIEN